MNKKTNEKYNQLYDQNNVWLLTDYGFLIFKKENNYIQHVAEWSFKRSQSCPLYFLSIRKAAQKLDIEKPFDFFR